ncbi:response regulator [Flavobacterium hungaricum]|uniref:DNA-binding response regulator n=1 Tax=Flavobacterium hungaricum TaxID=2082725 RepID=A0ABR9TM49_9FLAO|nr:response regulator [Flavobacterium hungaricum]MBE8726446.1 DNA-binding response regulator [Flavobacterium hungaricum]
MIRKILIVEDHPSMITGYQTILSHNKLGHELEFYSANNCKDAYDCISNETKPISFDLVMLDYSLPAFPEKEIFNGGDLAILVHKYIPGAKTLIITSHFESVILYNIYQKTQVNGILVKTDFDDEELLLAYEKIMSDENYFSKTAKKAKTERLLAEGHFDSLDRQIITLISKGCQIKTIANTIKVSEDTVKKRKSKIKDILGIDKGNDEDILRECRLLQMI